MRSGTRTASSGLCPRISSQTQSGTLRRWAPSTRKTSSVPPSTTIPSSKTGGTLFRAGPCTSTARDAGDSGRAPGARLRGGTPAGSGARATIPSRRAGRGGPSRRRPGSPARPGRCPRARSRTRSRSVNLAPAGARCPGRRRGRHRRREDLRPQAVRLPYGQVVDGRGGGSAETRNAPPPGSAGPRGGEDEVEDGHLRSCPLETAGTPWWM